MSLRAEIVIIDDDENIPNVVKVPMYKCAEDELGVFAENMVIDPDTGEVYKFTFQAEVVGQIAPKHEEPKAPEVEAGDTVKIVASANRYWHALKIGSVGKVRRIESDGAILVDGIMEDGHKLDQHVAPEDVVVVDESPYPKPGDIVRIIGNDNPVHHNLKVGELAEVLEVDSYGDIRAEGVGLSGRTIGQYVSRDDYILE